MIGGDSRARIKAKAALVDPEPLRPLGPLGGRALVLGNRPGPAAAARGADRHRPDRRRRRLARRRRSAIRAASVRVNELLLLLPPADVDRGRRCR